jgi:anti-sigma-K factor RskA
MSDWLGMVARPRMPRPGAKAEVLARARASRRGRPRWPGLAAAAALVAVGGGAWWAYTTVTALRAERARLVTEVAAARDSLSYLMGATSRVIQIPVSTNGRLGAITIFADSTKRRWLVRCDGLAPNQSNQAYQLWFLTDRGVKSAAVMAMDTDVPMVLALDLPVDSSRVTGAAMSIEARRGSAEPRGPMVFQLNL